MGWRRSSLGIAALAACALTAPSAAAGDSPPPLGLSDCGPSNGVYTCSGLVPSWDGVPLDTTVALPSARARPRALVVLINGFGNSKYEYLDPASSAYTGNAYEWAKAGYAVLTYTARGLWGSCGTPEARLASPAACANGYIHLADVRYEVRDAQELIGRLVDEGVADPARIGVAGDSYGGGQSLMLAALRDRVMLPDGTLVPWRSADGTPLSLAAAAPVIPWSDLLSAAAPNGRVTATGVTSRAEATSPVGVAKATFVSAIFAAAQTATGPGQPTGEPFIPGRPMGFLAPIGLDPEADVAAWVARTDAGEPYNDAMTRGIVRQLADYHSAYYIDPSSPPPPLFLASGFDDDLFPVDEVLRFTNRTRARYPRVPVSMLLGDFGHQRAANKPVERRRLVRDIRAWFDHYLRGRSPTPRDGVTAYAQTCPRSVPSRGPFRAPDFAGLADGVIRFVAPGAATVSSTGIDPAIGAQIDPVTGGGNGCVALPPGDAPGTVRYAVTKPATADVTILGSPRIRADLSVDGAAPDDAQLAGRLWDVAPDGQRRLIARGSYRPRQGANRWQLHPASYVLASGHSLELELLGADVPYGRPSNATFTITVDGLRFSVPTRGG